MTGLWVGLGVLLAYFVAGFCLARWQLPRAWAKARQECFTESSQRSYVLKFMWLCVLGWPVPFPKTLIQALFNHVAVSGDPEHIKALHREKDRTIKQQQEHIRQLEIELGIGQGDRG